MVPSCGLDLCPSAHGGGEAEAGAPVASTRGAAVNRQKEGEQGTQKEGGSDHPKRGT